jgi:simple sugar transport system ATP-binding protein
VAESSPAELAQMMVGTREIPTARARTTAAPGSREVRLRIDRLSALDDTGLPAVSDLSLQVRAGEIVGVAGVSGNGQRELVESLIGQRAARSGSVQIGGAPYHASRAEIGRLRVFSLPEEPLRNACVGSLSVAENMALRNFDRAPLAAGPWLRRRQMLAQALRLIREYKVKTRGPEAELRTLSGGNVQRVVLARELASEVSVLVVANPVFGLDFAAVAEIHTRILAAREAGAAVLLVSEDLDELLELADRIVVMFGGRIVHETPRERADVGVIGRCMAGHAETAAAM